jgi:DNA-binding Lrp family transcriptional regulator
MKLLAGEISTLVFERIVRNELGEFSMDHRTLTVLMELDGQTDLARVAQSAGLTMSQVREVMTRLLQLGLIRQVTSTLNFLDQDFVEHLTAQLSLAVGPIAGLLLEDEMQDMGFSPEKFPIQRAPELIDRLAREIRRDDKKSAFKKHMVQRMQEKGYL